MLIMYRALANNNKEVSMINKNNLKKNLALYLVTDRGMITGGDLLSAVEMAVKGGVTIVQLREKNASYDEFLARGIELKSMLDRYDIPLIINDNVDICIALDAYGVHLGQSDGNILDARKRLGEDKVIGASARTVEGARLAELQGADYLGIGAVFGTSTKLDASTISPDILGAIASSIHIPVVAIGGVSECNISQLEGKGASGVAVISAILKADDITDKASIIKKLADKIII